MKWLQFCLVLACTILFTIPAFAEKGDRAPAYIINNDGKKIDGTMIVGSLTDNEVKIKFKKKGDSKDRSYKPTDIQAYGFHETIKDEVGKKFKTWKHFETQIVDYPPKPFASKTVFMQREVDGPHKLFCYYIEQRANVKEPIKYTYYVKSEGGDLKKVEENDFQKFSKSFFKDYTALYNQIGDKNFRYFNLSRMVRDYNYWLENKHDATVYKMAPQQFVDKSIK